MKIHARDLKIFARTHDLRQVIVLGWDGRHEQAVGYGKNLQDAAVAEKEAAALKGVLKWPLSLTDSTAKLLAVEETCESMKTDLAKLGAVLLDEFGGPQENESVCEAAIRILRAQKAIIEDGAAAKTAVKAEGAPVAKAAAKAAAKVLGAQPEAKQG